MLFCTLVAEGCWGRQGCCPHTAEFALPVLGQDKVWGRETAVGLQIQVPALTVLQVGAHKPAATEFRVTPAAEGESSLQSSCRDKTLLLP